MRRPCPLRLAWTALEGELHAADDARMYTCVGGSLGKTDSMHRDFGGGGGGGMKAKDSERVLGPVGVQSYRKRRCICAGAYNIQCAGQDALVHARHWG
jgi:hypothetical protein